MPRSVIVETPEPVNADFSRIVDRVLVFDDFFSSTQLLLMERWALQTPHWKPRPALRRERSSPGSVALDGVGDPAREGCDARIDSGGRAAATAAPAHHAHLDEIAAVVADHHGAARIALACVLIGALLKGANLGRGDARAMAAGEGGVAAVIVDPVHVDLAQPYRRFHFVFDLRPEVGHERSKIFIEGP